MKNILVLGVGRENINYKKITGFINVFKKRYKKYNVLYSNGNANDSIENINEIIRKEKIDIIFGESAYFMNLNYSGVEHCFIWVNLDIFKGKILAENNKKTNFYICCKSSIHHKDLVDECSKRFGNKYQIHGIEGQLNLSKTCSEINNSEMIFENTYILKNNLVWFYLPCCLGEQPEQALNSRERDIDLCYYGTTYNRPAAMSVLTKLKDKGYNIMSSHDGIKDPEEVIKVYAKSKFTISEMTHPVKLEYPVRLGEAAAQGCILLMMGDECGLKRNKSSLVPYYENVLNVEEVEEKIKNYKYKQIKHCYHEQAIDMIEEIIIIMKTKARDDIRGVNTPIRWDELTEQEKNNFTMNNSIQKLDFFKDDDRVSSDGLFWSKDTVSNLIAKASRKEESYYRTTDTWLYDCLLSSKTPALQGKSIAVLGSVIPWYEAICLSIGAKPITIEYNKIHTDDDRLTLMTVDEYNKNPIKFDYIISISSIEHDGLNRYGDPLNPDGDLIAMKNIKENMLNEGGILFLAVPLGVDKVVWNAHRIYGPKRWPMLLDGFEIIYSSGYSESELHRERGTSGHYQPVVVLKPL